MRVKLDENLPARLVRVLSDLGNDVDTVPAEGLKGKPDLDVWREAQRERRFLVTQDLDFSDRRTYQPGTHCGLLLLRLREPSRESLIRRVEEIFRTEDVEGWLRCFVVATENKTRVVRPDHD